MYTFVCVSVSLSLSLSCFDGESLPAKADLQAELRPLQSPPRIYSVQFPFYFLPFYWLLPCRIKQKKSLSHQKTVGAEHLLMPQVPFSGLPSPAVKVKSPTGAARTASISFTLHLQ